MNSASIPVDIRLPGWELFWARLARRGGDREATAALRRRTEARVRETYAMETLPSLPVVAALRRLFQDAGCDPSRYRPSSEALLRRLLKGAPLPAIHPLVDLNNCLSAELAVPCCVLSEGSFEPPLVLRSGQPGESFVSLKGPFRLEGKPVLADRSGPFGSPITDSRRVKITPGTDRAWLVAYLPAGVLGPRAVRQRLDELLEAAPVAEIDVGL